MNALKKYLGIVWMLLSPGVIFFLLWQAYLKIGLAASSAKANVTLQWTIILLIFIPVCIGLFIFGYYAYKEYYTTAEETDLS